ncbi:MAG: 50S ribosomal protein L29 [Thaumarchaeota archaeon]|nr:MAG: 50S ribosomal protein L29 [Nitrososphaerota archaeon]
MPNLKPKLLREQEPDKLRETLFDLRAELSKLRSTAARGLNKKDTGKIRKVRRDIARVLTTMTERGLAE